MKDTARLAKDELCPRGVWRLGDLMNKVLSRRLSCLPRTSVPENESRYPGSAAGMRAFLDTFFARHFFQVQDSLMDYIISNEFAEQLKAGQLSVLDIGCGPALGTLAVTDMVRCVVEGILTRQEGFEPSRVAIRCVLNDTSRICLGTGKLMLNDYADLGRMMNAKIPAIVPFPVEKPFPESLPQLQRIARNNGRYDLIVLSYVAIPLDANYSDKEIADGLNTIRSLCSPQGRILILQDRFREKLVSRMTRLVDEKSEKRTLRQSTYSSKNDNEVQTYQYYSCIYAP